MSENARLLAALELADGEPPAKHSLMETWSVGEIDRFRRTGEKPLSPEYVAYAKRAAKAAGLDPAEFGLTAAEKPYEEMTVQEHFDRLRSR